MAYTLIRKKSNNDGTLGELKHDGSHLCFTIELPWLDNHHQTSCIPIGNYNVEKYQSPKHGQVWQVMNVPNRYNIEIHGANTINDLLGCIGVGSSIGTIGGLPAVLNSQKTLSYLRAVLPDNFTLEITNEA